MEFKKREFFKYYVIEYIKYTNKAEDEYFNILTKYKALGYLRENALEDAKALVYKYIEIAVKDLNEMGINISNDKFFKDYYREKYFYFEKDFEKLRESINSVYEYEKNVLSYINSNNSSNLKFAPRNLASIPTALALNAASAVIGGAAKTMMNRSENQKLLDKVHYEKQKMLNEIIQSEFLERSLSNSIFDIYKAFLDCVESYTALELYRPDDVEEIKQLLTEGINMVLVDEYRQNIRSLDKREKKSTNKNSSGSFENYTDIAIIGGLILFILIIIGISI